MTGNRQSRSLSRRDLLKSACIAQSMRKSAGNGIAIGSGARIVKDTGAASLSSILGGLAGTYASGGDVGSADIVAPVNTGSVFGGVAGAVGGARDINKAVAAGRVGSVASSLSGLAPSSVLSTGAGKRLSSVAPLLRRIHGGAVSLARKLDRYANKPLVGVEVAGTTVAPFASGFLEQYSSKA